MFRRLVVATLSLGLVAACANNQGQPQVGQRTAAGAVIGALGGAIAGASVTKKDRRGALIGAGVGLLAGAAVGNYLDRQQRELEQNLEGTGATVTNTGEELVVNMPASVTFGVDSAAIQPQFYGALDRVSDTLSEYPSSLIDVVGHTDATGSDEYNRGLSERRAQSVANYITGRGVLRQRVAAFGVGESQPVATNETAQGRQQNRRVEMRIIPQTQA